MKRRLLCAAGVAVAALAGPAASAHAQGSAVQTHSSCATAMGAAGVAAPCEDGSAVLFNPAALSRQRSVVGVGWSGITTSGSFAFDPALGGQVVERESRTSSVPFGFLNWRVSDRLAAGIGVFAPYGLGVFWDEEGDFDFEGRFVSYDTDLRNIYIQPTVSFALSPRLSLGAGVDVIRSSIEINQRVDLAATALPAAPGVPAGATFGNLGIAPGTDFANARLAGDGTAYTFHVGALAELTDFLSVGVRYMGAAEVEFDGDAEFTQVQTGLVLPVGNPLSPTTRIPLDNVLAAQFAAGAPLSAQSLSTSLVAPAQFVVGAALRPTPALKILADYQWTGWSEWDEADIDFETAPDQVLVLDYQDTHTYRFGAELAALEALTVRGGFIYNTAAQKEFSVSPLLPEAERNYWSAGLGYAFMDNFRIDLGYQYVDQSARRGRVRPRPATVTDENALRALNVGVFTADASVFNVTLAYQFGARR